jgi:flagellar M-ring protein FliF
MSELITTPSDLRVVTASPSAAPNVGSVLQRVRSFTQQAAVAKAMPAIGLVAVLGLAALLWAAFSSPPQRDLFRGLADADKGAVAEALQSAGIAYEVDRGTGALTVSDSQYYEAKMLLAQQGLPKSAPDGDALMSSMPMGASRAVESERLRGSRELDLARTIEAIDAVQSARVHLAVEQPSVFLRDQKQAAASVMLKLNGGRSLTENQVQAITNLVASSVPGLSPEAVSIVDQAGRLLSRAGGDPAAAAADRQLSLQAQIEQRYADSLDKLLTPAGRCRQLHRRSACGSRLLRSAGDPRKLSQGPGRGPRRTGRLDQGRRPDGLATGIPGALSNTPPAATTVTTAPDQTMLANGAPAAGTAAGCRRRGRLRTTTDLRAGPRGLGHEEAGRFGPPPVGRGRAEGREGGQALQGGARRARTAGQGRGRL